MIILPSLCPYSAASQEQISYMGQQRPRNDGNVPLAFRWGTNAGVSTYQQGANNNYNAPPPSFTQAPRPQHFNPHPPQQSSSKLEDLVLSIANDTKIIMQDNKTFKDQMERTFQNHAKSINHLEAVVGQMCKQLNVRMPGTLPSQTEINPNGTNHEQVKAVTLRSGKESPEASVLIKRPKNASKGGKDLQTAILEQLEDPRAPRVVLSTGREDGSTSRPTGREDEPWPDELLDRMTTHVDHSIEEDQEKSKIPLGLRVASAPLTTPNPLQVNKIGQDAYVTPIPFPRRFAKQKKEQSDKDILEVLSKVQVNIPLLDTIKQIPRYAKFIKELCTNKRKLDEVETIAMSEEAFAVLQRKLPPKLKDPGRFTIPCTIG